MGKYGLTKAELEGVGAVLSKHPEVEEAILYGSRAMGNFKPASDIDLTLKGGCLDSSLQTEVEFELDDLMLPYKFDISIFDKITSPEFLDHIKRVGITIYSRK